MSNIAAQQKHLLTKLMSISAAQKSVISDFSIKKDMNMASKQVVSNRKPIKKNSNPNRKVTNPRQLRVGGGCGGCNRKSQRR